MYLLRLTVSTLLTDYRSLTDELLRSAITGQYTSNPGVNPMEACLRAA